MELKLEDKKISLTEGLLLAAIPAIGYWCAYMFQKGFCAYYGIPEFFIEVSALTLLSAIAGILFLVAMTQVLIEILYSCVSSLLHTAILFSLVKVFLFALFFVGCSYVFRISIEVVFFTTGLIFFLEFILPLITQRKVNGYINKLDAQEKVDLQVPSTADFYINKLGRNFLLAVLLLTFLTFISFLAGGYRARSTESFLILATNPEMVVLRTYKDSYVAAEFDRKKKTILPSYRLFPIENSEITMTSEKLGLLRVSGNE